jgi:hypothetical protein
VNRSSAGFPCAVVYGLLRALPGDRAFLPPSPARCEHRGRLERQHRGARTTRLRRPPSSGVRLSPLSASTASRRNVRDVRTSPLIGRDARIEITDLPDDGSEIFFGGGVDRVLVICPTGCFVAGVIPDFACGKVGSFTLARRARFCSSAKAEPPKH